MKLARSVAAKEDHAAYVRRWRADIAGREPPNHGTLNAYTNYACRCPECVTVKREYDAALRVRNRAR